MFCKISTQLLTAFLAAAGVTLIGSIVGLVGLNGLTHRLDEITDEVWPTADMCMEYWIGSLAKSSAAYRYLGGDVEGAQHEIEWARTFTANSLAQLRAAGRLPHDSLEELERLDREGDAALNAFLDAVDRERESLAMQPPDPALLEFARQSRSEAAEYLDSAIQRIAIVITPVEESTDTAMSVAAAEGVSVAERTRLQLLCVAAASIAGAILISITMTSRIVGPLKMLSDATGRIADGRLSERVGIRRGDEIGRLAGQFDAMAEELAKSRDELLASEARYRSLFEYARDGLVVLDTGGEVAGLNPAFATMCGRSREDLEGEPFKTLLSAQFQEEFEACLDEMISRGNPIREIELLRRDGARVATEARAVSLPDHRLVISFRDISRKRRMEQAMMQAEKLSAIGQLAAGVGHELRNPLFVISNVLHDLRESLPSSEQELVENLAMASEESGRARRIIDDLLEFARPADPSDHELRPVVAIEQILRMFRKSCSQRGIELKADFETSQPCYFHPDGFKQVMVNLVTNALDAMPRGGQLAVGTRVAEHGAVEVSVTDSGKGIPEELQKQIFNPFFSTKPPGRGTGLGLWIVHSTVRRYYGDVQVRSAEGRGTTFRLLLGAGGPPAAQRAGNGT